MVTERLDYTFGKRTVFQIPDELYDENDSFVNFSGMN